MNMEEKINQYKAEFESLRNDDEIFKQQYKANEFKQWLIDNELKGGLKE